ncbi:hypothetical protein IEO21_02229 [Rhodonia placenta]|uniref:4Fe-4S ferredoxin-type domain-containing protein n=1 Tax=Rhodonia placenta TaxID=104341 RepID=A0A8H7U5F4_9APHY|nr:hypothetical protein IEO21_02229 [Postia placenta]
MPAESPPRLNAAARHRRATRNESAELKTDLVSAREIELKRSRGEISCAECRSASLWNAQIRCDKSIPCQSCQRRGCASLCPNGSLATGQGTRFVLAATEHLHRRIAKMSERVRQVEDALAILQAKCSNQPHPLLSGGRASSVDPDDDSPDLEPAQTSPLNVTDTFGMLSISNSGVSTFFGPTGGVENDSNMSPGGESDPVDRHDSLSPAPEGLIRFSDAFPFTPLDPPHAIMELIRSYLPSYERACYLGDIFLEHAGWMFSSLPRDQLVDEMIPFYYREANKPLPSIDYSGAHSLALLLFTFAAGALCDPDQETYNAEAAHFYQLARAALCLESVWVKPSLMTIQVLHMHSVYTAMVENPHESGDTDMAVSWGMVTLACTVAMSVHRDSARWDLPKFMVERRRLVFWNIFQADSWQSLTTGRPPSFVRTYIDCKYPRGDYNLGKDFDLSDFEIWFTHFAFQCVADVAMKTLAAEPPSYETIMELDKQVREFQISPGAIALVEGLEPASTPDIEPTNIATSMQNFVAAHSREVLLLYIHRAFFAQALIDHPKNPVRSEYAHSYLTAYRCARTIVKMIRGQYAQYPGVCSRIWPIWTYGFSATVVLGMVVTRSPQSPLATEAMIELSSACELFTQAGRHNRRAAKALGILLRLQDKARNALATAQPTLPVALDPKSEQERVKTEMDQDQLEIFAGRKASTAKQSSQWSMQSRHSQNASSSSHLSYTPPRPQEQLYPSPGQNNWLPQELDVPQYSVPAGTSWYRAGSYTQTAPDYGWTNQGHAYPTMLPHAGNMVPSGSPLPVGGAQQYRHASQVYPGPSGLHMPQPAQQYPHTQLVDPASRGNASLDARWTSFIHEEGCLDDGNFRP